jgi:pSer/pThr/pTyr-binding forkhead associated (FHA) protein
VAFFKPSQLPAVRKTQTIEFAPEKSVVKRLVEFFKKSDAEVTPSPAPASVPIKRAASPSYIRTDYKTDYSQFARGDTIILRAGDQKIVINKVRRDILLGRVTNPSKVHEQYVTINLMKYVGARTGLSRVHALIRPANDNKLVLIDLNSTNGTRLNRRPCVPFKTYVIYSGDEIQLADVVMTIQILQSRVGTSEDGELNTAPAPLPTTRVILTTKPLSPKLLDVPSAGSNNGKSK